MGVNLLGFIDLIGGFPRVEKHTPGVISNVLEESPNYILNKGVFVRKNI